MFFFLEGEQRQNLRKKLPFQVDSGGCGQAQFPNLGAARAVEKGLGSKSENLDLFGSPSTCSFPGGSDSKESPCNVGDLGSIPGLGRSPGERERLPIPVFWPGEFHGLYSPWGGKELDMI